MRRARSAGRPAAVRFTGAPALLAGGLLALLAGAAPPFAAADAGASPSDSPPTSAAQTSAAPRTPSVPQAPVETIEVRATADELALDGTAFGTLIRAQDFAGRVTSVPELLRESVGVQVQSLGGGFATVSVRGSSAEQVMVYLDGVPLNRALGGSVNLADLPLAQVDSIEIYRGFTPASLPAASIGGAILIHSRRPQQGSAGAASAAYGSFDTAEITASATGGGEAAAWSLGFDTSRSDGDFTYRADNGTQIESSDDTLARRRNNDSRQRHLNGRASLRLGRRARLALSTDLFDREQGVPGIGSSTSTSARLDTSRLLLRSEIEAPGLLGGRLLLRGALDYARQQERFDDRDDAIGLQPQDTNNRIGSLGGEVGGTLVLSSRNALSILAAQRRESADLINLVSDPGDLGVARREAGVLTLEDQVSLWGGRLLVSPSLRHERWDSRFRPGGSTGLVPDSLNTADSETTGKIGLRAALGPRLTLRANAGRFLRLPEFRELFGDRGSIIGNPSLLPERGRSLDAGIGMVTGPARDGALLRRASFEVTLFETKADELIAFVPLSTGVAVARNLGRSRIRGGELSLALALGRRFSGSLNATRQRAVDISGGINDGNLLPGRPQDELSATAGLDLRGGRGRLYYGFTYVGPNYTEYQNLDAYALPARYLHDVGLRLRLPRGLDAVVEVKNIGDELTFDVARFPLPGRSLHGRLTWSF